MDTHAPASRLAPTLSRISSRSHRCVRQTLRLTWAALRRLGLLLPLSLSACAIVPGSYYGKSAPAVSADGTAQAETLHEGGLAFHLQRLDARTLVDTRQSALSHAPALPVTAAHDYLIEAGDVLAISVWGHPEFNSPSTSVVTATATMPSPDTTSSGASAIAGAGTADATLSAGSPTSYIVDHDGSVFFPYVGIVHVAGLTTESLRSLVTSRLGHYIKAPQVSVSVASYRSQKVFVVGQVRIPGTVAMSDIPTRVTDAIAHVGGYTPDADLEDATLTRGTHHYDLNLYDLYYQGNLTNNVLLRNGDVITIPDAHNRKVFVLGEVRMPASQIMPRGRLSLAEAISDAGGLNQLTANASQVYVFRHTDADDVEVYHLDASSPSMLALADEFSLRPHDIVFVDAALVTRFDRVISQIMPFAASMYYTTEGTK